MGGRVVTVSWQDRTWRVAVAGDGSIVVHDADADADAVASVSNASGATSHDGEVVLRTGDRVHRAFVAAQGETRWVFHDGRVFEFSIEAEAAARRRSTHHHGPLTAPMPATVLAIHVKPGDRVARSQTLLVLEAMKMELPLRAAGDGVVRAIHCREGDLVQPGASLIDLE